MMIKRIPIPNRTLYFQKYLFNALRCFKKKFITKLSSNDFFLSSRRDKTLESLRIITNTYKEIQGPHSRSPWFFVFSVPPWLKTSVSIIIELEISSPVEKRYLFPPIIFLANLQRIFLRRRDGRAVECGGLENRWPKRSGGSNPSLSAE